jgi:tryptophanyl-tRNA synthetase
MYTDPNRIRADVPGKVEGNPVFIYHDVFNRNRGEVEDLKERYRGGKVGDVEVKQKLADALNSFLEPFRELRQSYAEQTGLVEEVIYDGTAAVSTMARDTVIEMKKAMGLTGVWNRISRKSEKAKKKRQKSAEPQ